MGKPHLNDWQRSEHFLKICPPSMREAWIEFETQPLTASKIDRLKMTFVQFQEYMRIVWSSTAKKQRLSAKYTAVSPVAPVHRQVVEHRKANNTTLPLLKQVPDLTSQPTDPDNPLKDIEITCKGCHTKFTFTVVQQEFHVKMGFPNQPAWCKTCIPNIQQIKETNMKKLPCFHFSQGDCARGDDCRFSHGTSATPAPAAPKQAFVISAISAQVADSNNTTAADSDSDHEEYEVQSYEDVIAYNRTLAAYNLAKRTESPGKFKLATVPGTEWDLGDEYPDYGEY